MSKEKADLVISGGTVLTMCDSGGIIENGAVAVKDGMIVGLGQTERIRADFSAKKKIDAEGCVVMPGLINAHTHLAMDIFRGVADDLPLHEWLTEHIFPLEDEFVNEDSAYRGGLLACAEMVFSGTTTFCDMYFHEQAVGRAAEKIGVRGVIGEGITTIFQDAPAAWERKRTLTEQLLAEFAPSKLVSVAVEPHSPYTCDAATLRAAKKFADQRGLLFIIHLAETKKEYDDSLREKGMTPVAYLDSLGVLDTRTLCAHCVWMGPEDLQLLRARGAKIAHCPQSNMKLGSGIAPAAAFLREGIGVSLGTDGAASNNTLDMFAEMKTAALLSKVAALDPTVLPARKTLHLATLGGAEALGREKELGSLEAGKKADIILVDFKKPHLTPAYDPYSHLVYCARGSDVRTVIIDGRVVMEDRRLLTADLKEIMQEVDTLARKIKASGRKK